MKLAWKELKYNWKKFFLVEIIVILMMFMVLFLSGLVKGLGSAVSSGIDNMQVENFVLSDDAEKLLTISKLTRDEFDSVEHEYGDRATSLDVQRMYIQKNKNSEKLDITYFAIDPTSFLNPEVYKGVKLSTDDYTIVLDDDFEGRGIKVGDSVVDSNTGVKLTVVGFTNNAMYGHVSVGYISTTTYTDIMKSLNPMYEIHIHAVALQGAVDHKIDGAKIYSKEEIIESIPGYKAEQMTISMVEWLLVVITAVIIGIFFFVINLQKEKEFGVLKALGMGMRHIVRIILSQVFIIAVSGALLSVILVSLMSAVLPATMPFTLVGSQVFLVLVTFVLISILGSLATVIRVAHVDPAQIIGGDL